MASGRAYVRQRGHRGHHRARRPGRHHSGQVPRVSSVTASQRHSVTASQLHGSRGRGQATAAALGVPVVALTGDDAACAEMTARDETVLTAPVKYARDRFAAGPRPAEEARRAVEKGAATAGPRTADARPRAQPNRPAT
ncbi:M55 family metallopeptidase [Streptomyces sp. NPDC048278]|uniref:M55 family metallopeptidase n=1 Tax=Streptomyces sp. NPDC048278 TaxID=3155809 RepID=UPI003433BC8B